MTPPVYVEFLNGLDIGELDLTDQEILDAVDSGLKMQGRGETSIEPRTHIRPRSGADGHFNVLRGWIGGSISRAGVKVVGDFVENYKEQRPSEYGIVTLFDPVNGAPRAILDGAGLTDMRTGAMTALGGKYLAPSNPKILGHVGSRGTAYWNVRLLASLFDFEEIRIHSRRAESRESFARKLHAEAGIEVKVCADWQSCVEGADIVVEAARLSAPKPLLRTEWIKPGSLVIPYGTMSAIELSLTDLADKFVMDDWGQAQGQFGAFREHIDTGRITRESLHAELCEIAVGAKEGRRSDGETILFWHRGLSLSDIALADAMLRKAEKLGIGQRLRFH